MERVNIEELINYLKELEDEKYNQEFAVHLCGTPSCLAGHACALSLHNKDAADFNFRLVPTKLLANYWVTETAQKWLGLDNQQAKILFAADPLQEQEVTKEDAIRVLKNLIKTNKVQWRSNGESTSMPQELST